MSKIFVKYSYVPEQQKSKMKQYKDQVSEFVRIWNFTRRETLEILGSLNGDQINFKPIGSPKWQGLNWQFGCIARTQIVYTKAIGEGKMNFKWFQDALLPEKRYIKSVKELQSLLKSADVQWVHSIRLKRLDQDFTVHWPGNNFSLLAHINALVAHERLHQGQLISYFTFAGFELPEGFSKNWAL